MACIVGIEYALPETVLTNEELSALYPTWPAEKIYAKTGVKTRHISAEDETAGDLGAQAAEKLFDSGIIKREDVDFIVLVTQSPDYVFPATSCVLQERLGLRKNIGAFDINLGCTGYIYGLVAANGLIESGVAENVLLITTETLSKHINPMDRSTRTIFGDGAAATLLGKKGIRIGQFDLGTDGSGQELLKIPAGGARLGRSAETAVEREYENGSIRSLNDFFMDGPGVFEFTLREVPKSIKGALAKENMKLEDADFFVLHQANQYMLDFLQKTMKIDREKFYINMADTGNTVCASIPIALKRAMMENKLAGRKTAVLCAFGVGLSWGSVVLHMEDNK